MPHVLPTTITTLEILFSPEYRGTGKRGSMFVATRSSRELDCPRSLPRPFTETRFNGTEHLVSSGPKHGCDVGTPDDAICRLSRPGRIVRSLGDRRQISRRTTRHAAVVPRQGCRGREHCYEDASRDGWLSLRRPAVIRHGRLFRGTAICDTWAQVRSLGGARTAPSRPLGPPRSERRNSPSRASNRYVAGRGAAWLARLTGGQEVAGSNPVAPTYLGGRIALI